MRIFPSPATMTRVTDSLWGQALVIIAVMIGLNAVWPAIAQAQTGTLIDDPAELAEGEVVRVEEGEVRQMAFSPDEATLAVATNLGLWIYGPSETSNGQLLGEAPVQALWWAPDGNLLAALLEDGALQIWQMTEPQSSVTLTSTAPFASVAWSPDSTQLATGLRDGQIELWAVGEDQPLETLEGHTDSVHSLYWFKNGIQLVSAAADGSVRVWEFENVTPVAATPAPTPTPPSLTALVQTDVLNIRSGPGTTFEKLGNVKRGENVTVIGQKDDCAWFQVKAASGLEGWMNGNPQFVVLNGECADLSTAPVAATATPTPTVQTAPQAATPTPTSPPAQAAAPTPTAAQALPTATPTAATVADPFPPNKGCFLFQNQLGPELTVTVTGKEGNFSDNFKVAEGTDVPYCLDPGRYTYTIDAPPPWADINGELDVKTGDRFMFPIRAQ